MSKAAIALSSALILLGACAAVPAAPTAPQPAHAGPVRAFEVRAGRCFGACPAYRFTADLDGAVVFEGFSDTAVAGETRLKPGPGRVAEALAALEPWRRRAAAGFVFPCDDRITDQPTYQVRWTAADGTVTELTHDRGCLSADGRAFAAVLDRLPSRLGLAERIGTPGR